MGEEEGTKIGSKLTKAFVDAGTAEEAADNWAGEFPVVREVMTEFDWVKPFLVLLASQLMTKVRWGVKARVIFGVATSMLDLATDIYVTARFKNTVKEGYFQASLARQVLRRQWGSS